MKLRFFCEQCGTEVPRNTVRCPTCGRYFTGIQCPQCGFQGSESDFASGCPSCGYMRVREIDARSRQGGSSGQSKKARQRRGGAAATSKRGPSTAASLREGALEPAGPPPSVYKVLGIVLLALIGILIAVILLL